MQIIRQKSTAPSPYLVMYAGADLTAPEIAALGVGWCDSRVSTTLAEVVSGVTLPTGFLPDCWTYNGAAWAVVAAKQDQVDVRIGMPSITVPAIGSATPGAVLTTEGVLQSYVDLTWAAVSTATSYEIRYAQTTDANWSVWNVQDSRTASNTYRINGLVAGKAYKFGIRANCLWGLSDWSADFAATAAIPSTPPGDVLGFAGSFANNSVSLSWTLLDALNLHTYEVRAGATWSTATVIRTGEKSGKWSFRPAASGATTYTIKARDMVGNYSAVASSVSVTVPVAAPPAALTTAGILFGIEVTVTYPQTPDIDYCEIWANTTNNRDTAQMVGITRDGKFTHNGLGNAATRYYWARTKNVFGENSTWYPVSSTAGVLGATVANPSDVIRLLNSQVDTSILASYLAGTGSFSDVLDTFTPAALAGVGGVGVFATKGQMLIAADKSIQLMAGSADVNAQILLLDTAIGLKLNQTGTVGAGLLISAPVGGKSSVQVWADAFQFCQPDGSGVKPVFTIGTVGGVSTFGLSGDMVLDGSLTAAKIGVGELIVGTNVTMGVNATISWANVTNQPTIPVVPSYITSTKITATTIESPTITAGTFNGSTFNLGDGTTYGKIETYDFANRATGIQILDGATPSIAVKGGSLTGATVTGGVIQTATSGKRTVIYGSDYSTASLAGELHAWDDLGAGLEVVASIGVNQSGSDYSVGLFGTESVTASNFIGVRGKSYRSQGVSGSSVLGIGVAGVSNNGLAGVYGIGSGTSGTGVRALGDIWDFYAVGDTAGYNTFSAGSYGPFTGSHDGLVAKSFNAIVGDILVDELIKWKKNISNCIAVMQASTSAQQKNVIGVLIHRRELEPQSAGTAIPYPWSDDYSLTYDAIILNSVGEGQINVCKDGGNIEAGDFICSSNRLGKGMKQADNLLHNYTVAKARESATWLDGEDNIKMIACTYHCG